MKRIYLDYAAATPMIIGALKVLTETAKKFPGNPSALHREGCSAKEILEKARVEIAQTLSARPDEIVFTSGATEANNLALLGAVRHAKQAGIVTPHVIVSAIEHPSVLESAEELVREGASVDFLPVDNFGVADLKALRKLITSETVLVSVMYANNEIGIIEPIVEIAKEIRHARKVNSSVYPYFHTDGAQAANYLDLNVLRLGIDMMTISSSKTYGPRGIGALFVKRGVQIDSMIKGGEHEGSRRAGTEAVALAASFSFALSDAQKIKNKESFRIKKLRDFLAQKIIQSIPRTKVNGNLEQSLPNILSVSFDGIEGDAFVIYLDAAGVAVSGKSACKSSSEEPSHVIMAICEGGVSSSDAIRFSLGRDTKKEDIVRVTKELLRLVPLLREAGSRSNQV